MAVAYAPLANGGFQVTPTAIRQIRGPGGKKNPFSRQRRKIFADGVAYEVTNILRDNMTGGTGGFANISGIPAAGKTGTTDNFVDAWFVGYTPELVAAVWVGYPNTAARATPARWWPGREHAGAHLARLHGGRDRRRVRAGVPDADGAGRRQNRSRRTTQPGRRPRRCRGQEEGRRSGEEEGRG